MNYHAILILNQTYIENVPTQYIHYWVNLLKEEMINDVLIPYFKGQIIKANYQGECSLLNLKQAGYLQIFRTKNKLSNSQINRYENNDPIGENCTEQILSEIRFDKSVEQTKPLLEKLILPAKHQIFVIMKFDDEHLDSAYKGVIRPLGEEFKYRVIRVDEIENSGLITDQILENIAESEIILSDLTGSRPNCYYETGIAHATGRELILTIKKNSKPHFDLQSYRFIIWETENELRIKLRKRLYYINSKI